MYDFIIVGQGIAGSLLSWFLMKEGQTVLVIDNYDPSSSSNIASGITKPITGQRFVKTWLADALIPFAEKTYKEFEYLFGHTVFHNIPAFKIFSSVKAVNEWSVRCSTEDYKQYLKKDQVVYLDSEKVKNDFGGFELDGVTRLDMETFLSQYRHFLKLKNALLERSINTNDIVERESGIALHELEARKIIFCEGAEAANNPYFKFLPFQLAKGECLIVKIENFFPDRIINSDVIILPTNEPDQYYVGATHEWKFEDDKPSAKGKAELEAKLKDILNCPYEIINHKAAIRPTVKDRRPFIGLHPQHPNIGIFNGMGTKGISLSPYFAQHFVEHLLQGKKLNEEVDIRRFL